LEIVAHGLRSDADGGGDLLLIQRRLSLRDLFQDLIPHRVPLALEGAELLRRLGLLRNRLATVPLKKYLPLSCERACHA